MRPWLQQYEKAKEKYGSRRYERTYIASNNGPAGVQKQPLQLALIGFTFLPSFFL